VKENMPMTTRTSPHLTLNNGVRIPAVGLGVFQSPPEQTAGAVESALTHGYRLVDTAAAYFNEVQVGEGLRRSGISRDEVFLETKVWISDYGCRIANRRNAPFRLAGRQEHGLDESGCAVSHSRGLRVEVRSHPCENGSERRRRAGALDWDRRVATTIVRLERHG
jgi:hypothetical protein